jgi:hypothetical protein
MPWLDSVAPAAPVVKMTSTAEATQLTWQVANPKKEPLRYVVYRFGANEKHDLERNDRIVSIQQGTEYTDKEAKKHAHSTYIITALDRMWNESKASNGVEVK